MICVLNRKFCYNSYKVKGYTGGLSKLIIDGDESR